MNYGDLTCNMNVTSDISKWTHLFQEIEHNNPCTTHLFCKHFKTLSLDIF